MGKILPPPKILPVGFEATYTRGSAGRSSRFFYLGFPPVGIG